MVVSQSHSPGSGTAPSRAGALAGGDATAGAGAARIARPPRPRRAGPRALGRYLPYLLILPSVAVLLGLIGWPLVNNVVISFRKLGLAELLSGAVVWTGLDNYRAILGDPQFRTVVLRTVGFTLINVVLTMMLGTLLALLMNRLGRVIRTILSLALVLSWAMPVIATTTVFQWLFDSEFGIVNWFLVQMGLTGFEDHSWFSTGYSTFFVIITLIVWQAVPFVAFSLYAGLTAIPGDLFEAVRVDGAGAWRTFASITFPLLKPLFLVLTFLSIIWDFKVFTQVYVIRQGGPNQETVTLPLLIYQQGIAASQFGVAAASAVVTVLLLLVALVFYIRYTVRQENVL